MSELENIDNSQEVGTIPTDNTTEELQENVEQSTGEVSGEVSGEVPEVPEDNSAEIEAEQERLRQEHEEYLNSFPETTVFYRDLLVDGDIISLGTAVKDPRVADSYGFLDQHYDESELTYIGTPSCGTYYLKGHERPQPTRQEMIERICAEVVTGIQELLDATAHSKGYDSGQAQAYVIWRGKLWRKCYQVKDQVIAGEIEPDVVNVDYIVNLVGPIGW